MIALWVLLGIAVVALASTIWPGWVRIFEPTPSRIPGAPVRTIRRWPVRAVSATLVAAMAAAAFRILWPDDATRDLAGSAAILVIGVGLGIWFLAMIVARHDAESGIRQVEDDEILDGSFEGEGRYHRRRQSPASDLNTRPCSSRSWRSRSPG